MKRVRVLIPFRIGATNTDYVKDDVIEVTEETLAKIKAINVNMVEVLGDVEPKKPKAEPKKRKTTAATKK